MEQIITAYGYLGIFIGTFLEGETVLILAGFFAHQGYLDLPAVIAVAFAGTVAGDQLYYFVGRTKGIPFLEKREAWKEKAEKVFSLLRSHQVLVMFGFRFLYGIRTVTPFMIGASRLALGRFILLNLLGSAIWALAVGFTGYLFGQFLDLFLREVKRFELWVAVMIMGVGLILWARYWVTRRRS